MRLNINEESLLKKKVSAVYVFYVEWIYVNVMCNS